MSAPYRLVFPMIALAASACEPKEDQPEIGLATVSQAISASAERVLGFESPADWSSSANLSQSTTHSQADFALAVSANGWTEVASGPLASLGSVGSSVSLDVQLSGVAGWGEVHLILSLPSHNIWWQDLGNQALTGLDAGMFHRFEFPLPADTEQALEGTYSDLVLRVVVSGPGEAGPYLLDNLDFTSTGNEPLPQDLVFPLPAGTDPRDVALAANGIVDLRDGVLVMGANDGGLVTNMGAGSSTLGVASETGTILSKPDITLRDRAEVNGGVRTAGTLIRFNDTFVAGEIAENAPFETDELSFRIALPSESGGSIALEPDQELSIEPGRYGSVSVKSRSTLSLVSGTYYFDDLQVLEPQAVLALDEDAGAVRIVVGNGLTFRGELQTTLAHPELLVLYRGPSTIFIEAPFQGSLVAPSAKVVLNSTTPGHSGAIFARDIELGPNTSFEHHPSRALIALEPLLTCVQNLGAGSYRAVFGFENRSAGRIDLPVGELNQLTPAPAGRGQPEVFVRPRVDAAFAVVFDGSDLSWTLAGSTVTAAASSPSCAEPACASCPTGKTCVGQECVTTCGDDLCAGQETCSSCAVDCSCGAGRACNVDSCVAVARCGIEWECGAGDSFGVTVDCGACGAGQICVAHRCQ